MNVIFMLCMSNYKFLVTASNTIVHTLWKCIYEQILEMHLRFNKIPTNRALVIKA